MTIAECCASLQEKAELIASSITGFVQKLTDHITNDAGYWNELQALKEQVRSMSLLLNESIIKWNAYMLNPTVPEAPPKTYDMTNPTVLKTPALLGALGFEILGVDKIGSGWTVPTDGILIIGAANTINLLTPTWIAVNGVRAAPSDSLVVLNLLSDGENGDIEINAGDVVTQSGMGNITFYPVMVA